MNESDETFNQMMRFLILSAERRTRGAKILKRKKLQPTSCMI